MGHRGFLLTVLRTNEDYNLKQVADLDQPASFNGDLQDQAHQHTQSSNDIELTSHLQLQACVLVKQWAIMVLSVISSNSLTVQGA